MNTAALSQLAQAAQVLAATISDVLGNPDAQAAMKVSSSSPEAAANGLLGYDGLAQAFAVDGVRMSDRNIKAFAKKHRRLLKKIEIGHRTVGFRPADVEKLKATLADDRL